MYPLLPIMMFFVYQNKKIAKFTHAMRSEYQQYHDDPSYTEEQKIMKTLEQYFTLRYEMLHLLRPLDLSFLADESLYELYRMMYELQRAKKKGLGIEDFIFKLEYLDLRIKHHAAEVKLSENNYVIYHALPDTVSRLRGQAHELILRKNNSGWKIVSDITLDLVTEAAKKSKKSLKQFLEETLKHPPYDVGEKNSIKRVIPLTRSYYDRQAAVSYAHQWALRYNPAYGNFTEYGGDCTNFASQVIHAGGKPMDYSGPHKWFYQSLNNRTPSWAGVDEIYSYLSKNTSGGASARVVSLNEVKPGDIVQLDFDDATWDYNHSPVVVKVMEVGNPSKILVSAHTINRDNYPLANYSYRRIRPLQIL